MPRLVTVVLRVSDLDRSVALYRDAFGAGAELVHEPKPQLWGRSARYRDPDANVIELTESA